MKNIAIIGGGAAGFFTAIRIAELRNDLRITIYEKSPTVLGKVRVSGGGRCNVTHHCFDPSLLVKFYPRGEKALLGPFNRFGPTDTVSWFESRGVELKTEQDGRMFPMTDDSNTIIQCLLDAAKFSGVTINTKSGIESFEPLENGIKGWRLKFREGPELFADVVIFAAGSSESIWKQLEALGISIQPPAPSLFTFNVRDNRIKDLMGLSVRSAKVKVIGNKLEAEGPLLITHWGMSGPGILKLSSWGAIQLKELNYKFRISINFLPNESQEEVFELLFKNKELYPKKLLVNTTVFEEIPKRLWYKLLEAAQINESKNWSDVNKAQLRKLTMELTEGIYEVNGKSTNKEEFVTCGGVDLNEIDFKTMQIKKYQNLFVCGEVINVDALTGGFNFQNAWTTGWIAGTSIAELVSKKD
jgi:predicted Rossmann fold flavoprotein